jgi:hypothetical protein
MDGRVDGPVLDRVRDQVAKQLLQAGAVPMPAQLACRRQLDPALRVRPAQLVQLVGHGRPEVDIGRHDLEAQAERRPVEVHQVVEQRLHRRAAPDHEGGRLGHLVSPVERRQVRRRHHDRVERASHVVPDRPEQQVARPFHLGVEMPDRLGDGLVDGLVETDDVLHAPWSSGPASIHSRRTLARRARYSATSWLMSKPLRALKTACVCAAVSGAFTSSKARPLDFSDCSARVWGVVRSLATASSMYFA